MVWVLECCSGCCLLCAELACGQLGGLFTTTALVSSLNPLGLLFLWWTDDKDGVPSKGVEGVQGNPDVFHVDSQDNFLSLAPKVDDCPTKGPQRRFLG
jgi:hypothetical protein